MRAGISSQMLSRSKPIKPRTNCIKTEKFQLVLGKGENQDVSRIYAGVFKKG